MVTKSGRASAGWCGECRDDEILAELKGTGDDRSTEAGEVVLVPFSHDLDEAV
jgi:hypothetical protein